MTLQIAREAPLTNTALQLLDDILAERKLELDPTGSMPDDEFFEFFSSQLILREYEPDPDDIKSGLVSQTANAKSPGTDGGIDSLYLFVNGTLIRDMDQAKELRSIKATVAFDVIIIQSTREATFNLARVLRLKEASDDIFGIEKQPKDFSETYNAELLDGILRFREIHRALLTKQPTINVKCVYAAKGDRSLLKEDGDLERKARSIEAEIKAKLPTITNCTFEFVGARNLIDLDRLPLKYTDTLRCSDSITPGANAHLALVELSEYNRFITGGGASILEHLFDSNVREYEGDVEVNDAIGKTLASKSDKADFWWLNNGITIVADKITGHPNELCLAEPRIVNGLQTSTKIAEHFKGNAAGPKRHVAIKLIESEVEMQDRIIKATNSQTRIPAQYLWATDTLQRDIEQTFRTLTPTTLHYARRKNSWKKAGFRIEDVVGITELAQAVAAIYLQQPDHARARPSRYFRKDMYKRVFSSRYPIDLYPVCALLKKRAERYLHESKISRQDINNLLFYVAMLAVGLHLKTPKAKAPSIANLTVDAIPQAVFFHATQMAKESYANFGATDVVAKGPDMAKDLRDQLVIKFSRKKGKIKDAETK